MKVDSSKGTKRALTEADEEKMLESLLYEGRNMFPGNVMKLEITEPVCEEDDTMTKIKSLWVISLANILKPRE